MYDWACHFQFFCLWLSVARFVVKLNRIASKCKSGLPSTFFRAQSWEMRRYPSVILFTSVFIQYNFNDYQKNFPVQSASRNHLGSFIDFGNDSTSPTQLRWNTVSYWRVHVLSM